MPRTFQSPIGEVVRADPTVIGYAAISFSASKTPSMFVFVSTFAETFLVAPLSPGVDALGFRLIFKFVRRLRGSFAAGLNIFYRSEFEWLNIRHLQLIARFDAFQFARIKLFKEMNVAVKFLGNGVSRITVGQKLQLCLRSYVARQPSNALQVCFSNSVWNEHRLHAAEIESVDVRRGHLRFAWIVTAGLAVVPLAIRDKAQVPSR